MRKHPQQYISKWVWLKPSKIFSTKAGSWQATGLLTVCVALCSPLLMYEVPFYEYIAIH